MALYNEKIKMIKLQRKTYEAIKVLNFGWINCDRFYKNNSPKVRIDLLVSDTTVSSAKFFAIFKEIKSVMNGYFSRTNNSKAVFRDIPINSNQRIIGIAFKGETPYWFEKDISAGKDVINVDFIESTQKDIEEKIKSIN